MRKAKDFLTGAAPGQIAPVIGDLYSKSKGRKIDLDPKGLDMLDNFVYFDAQYVWNRSDRACTLIEEGTKAGDKAKVDEGVALAREVADFYDKELFNTLGFMFEKIDPEDYRGKLAAQILGNDEYPFVYYNNARVLWNMYVALEKKNEEDFEQARQRMVQMKEIVTANEPVKFKQVAEKTVQRHQSKDLPLWVTRWRKAIELDDLIYAEQERIAAAKGEAPKQTRPEGMAGWEISVEGGEGIYRNAIDSFNVFGTAVKIHLEILDADLILKDKTLPAFKDFQVRRNRLPMEIGIVDGGDGPGSKIRFSFKSITAVDESGEDLDEPKFNLQGELEWTGEDGKVINPEINFEEIDEDKIKAVKALAVVIWISRAD